MDYKISYNTNINDENFYDYKHNNKSFDILDKVIHLI
jgi:hypothetical protein